MASVLSVKSLTLQYGLQKVLEDATFAVEDGEKVGLVGRNGSGKSSLLKIAAGLENPDTGTVSRRQGLIVGYLSQEFTLEEDATVLENVRAGAAPVLELIAAYESGTVRGAAETELLDHLTVLGAWDLESRIKTAMTELALPDPERICRGLSGGEKRRVALCRAIVAAPDLLLLDEPTNHLDADSIRWLEEFLLTFKGACLFVTHDRYFLERIARRILELDEGRLFSHPGNYRCYLEAKTQRAAAAQSRETRRQRFLRSELEFVRAGVRAQRRKSRYRLDQYHQIAAQEAPPEDLDVELLFPPPPPLANVTVEAKDIAFQTPERMLFSGLTLTFDPGTCTGVVGRNGAGKTTLLRVLMGQLAPTAGQVVLGKKTVFNYVDQQRLALDGSKSVLEEIGGNSDFVTWGEGKLHVRSYLKRFLFQDERVLMRIDRLSGGERSRLLLAKILLRGGNFVILDEPTNDLDLPTLRILEEAILDFPGCAIVVSHDRYFLDRVCDRVLVFEPSGALHLSAGNYSYYLEKNAARLAAEKSAAAWASATASDVAAASSKPQRTEPDRKLPARKLTWKQERELEAIEPQIAAEEEAIARLESDLANPEFYSKQAAAAGAHLKELDQRKANLQQLYSRWEELETIRQQSGGIM